MNGKVVSVTELDKGRTVRPARTQRLSYKPCRGATMSNKTCSWALAWGLLLVLLIFATLAVSLSGIG